jgi:exosome complex RNA-binding protein Csl4
LPEAVTDDGDSAGTVQAFVFRQETTTAGHLHAQHVEEIRRDVGSGHRHRNVAQPEPEAREPADVIRGESVEHRLPRAVVEIVRVRKGVESLAAVAPAAFAAVGAADFGEATRVGDS